MGHIRKLNGLYYIDFIARGLLYSQAAGTSLEEARQLLKDIEDKIAAGEALTINRSMDLPDFFERFLAQAAAGHGPRTAERFRSTIEHFSLFLRKNFPGIRRLDQLTPVVIETYRLDLSKTTKPNIANLTLLLLRDILEYGIKLGFIHDNPSLHVRLMPWRQPPPRKMTARCAQAGRLLSQGLGLGRLAQLLKMSDVARVMYFAPLIPLKRKDIS